MRGRVILRRMGKSNKVVWAAVCIAAMISVLTIWIAYVLSPPAPRPPVYQGKTLYQWIAVLDEAVDHPAKFEGAGIALAAIHAMGTNALPFALENPHAHVTLLDRVTLWLAKQAPFSRHRVAKDPPGTTATFSDSRAWHELGKSA